MKLPEIKKGSVVSFQAEELSNGKVRVSIQTEDKEVTFDWKVLNSSSSLGLLSAPGDASNSHIAFYFGIKFSQEDWKIAVDWFFNSMLYFLTLAFMLTNNLDSCEFIDINSLEMVSNTDYNLLCLHDWVNRVIGK